VMRTVTNRSALADVPEPDSEGPRSRWRARGALAVPFLLTVAALRGLTVTLPIFHGPDERVYHYPTILRFASQLPFPDLGHYNAAQTPLFHVLLAYVGQVTGYELWRLRLVETVISYVLALAVYHLLHRRLELDRAPSLALTLLFLLSPYVFGASFRVVTDNLAVLFVVIGIERLETFRQTGRVAPFAVACAAVGAAMLTRQSTAFMIPVAGLYALCARLPWGARGLLLALLGLALVPVGALFLTWHGLVPPGGDPSSCGLCSQGSVHAGAGPGLEAQTAELTLATIGLYGLILFAPRLVLAWRARGARPAPIRDAAGPLIGAGAGVLVLLLWPATSAHGAGLIWNAAGRFPTIDHSSLVFWGLVPLSGAILWWRIRVAPRRWIVVVFLGCFLLTAPAIRLPWQKYVDPMGLLSLLLTVRPNELASRREAAGIIALAAGFIAYTVSFVT
jgi:hypothetical protein